MSVDEVVEQFRPIFRAELPERMSQIHAALQAQSIGERGNGLAEAFRHAHNLAGTAAALEAVDVAATAEKLSLMLKAMMTELVTAAGVADAWRTYDALRVAAAAFLGSDAPSLPAVPLPETRRPR